MSKRKRSGARPHPPEVVQEPSETPVSPEEVAGALWADAAGAEASATAPAEAPVQEAQPEAAAPADAQAKEIERLKAESAEYLDGWQRARAEFANYKKRVERENEETRTRVAGALLTRFVGVLDDLERALKDRPQTDEAAAWASGIDLIYRKWLAILEAEGIQPIQPDGGTFDPNFHEAVSHEVSDGHTEGQIIEVIHQGYRLGDRVLRPALVRVAK